MLPPISLQQLTTAPQRVRELVVRTPALREAFGQVARYAASHATIILVGPTGTGKTLLAEAAHWLSGRAGPLMEVSGPELASELAEDVLFGHEAGAFTNAQGRRIGVLAEASRGTVVLDDFDRTNARAQGSLLRVLHSGKFRSLGANRDQLVSCRFIVCLRKCTPSALEAPTQTRPCGRLRPGDPHAH